jgi:Leucine-rich repeat (LRR) protein
MKRLPDAIGALTNLSTLGLGRNQLEYIPSSARLLTALKYIDVHVNRLHTVLPEEVFHEWERVLAERETMAVFVQPNYADTPPTPSTPATPASRPSTSSYPNTPSTPSRRLRRNKSLHGTQEVTEFQRLLSDKGPLPKGGVVLLAGLRDLECSYNELDELPDLSEMVSFKHSFDCLLLAATGLNLLRMRVLTWL